jgi:hypothetical protein
MCEIADLFPWGGDRERADRDIQPALASPKKVPLRLVSRKSYSRPSSFAIWRHNSTLIPAMIHRLLGYRTVGLPRVR